MPDLGPQLEREGANVDLEPGALERFEGRLHRRQRNRQAGVYVVALFVFAAIVLLGLTLRGPHGSVPATSPSPPKVSSQTVLPPGTYWTAPLTRSQLRATMGSHGFATTRAAQRFFRDLGPFSHSVRFGIHVQTNGIWNQFEQRDGGRKELGWSGAYHAQGPDQMAVLGYGCTVTYEINHLAGGGIGIRVLSDQGPSNEGLCGQQDLVAQTAIYETASFRPRG